jgi:hypothetical protein
MEEVKASGISKKTKVVKIYLNDILSLINIIKKNKELDDIFIESNNKKFFVEEIKTFRDNLEKDNNKVKDFKLVCQSEDYKRVILDFSWHNGVYLSCNKDEDKVIIHDLFDYLKRKERSIKYFINPFWQVLFGILITLTFSSTIFLILSLILGSISLSLQFFWAPYVIIFILTSILSYNLYFNNNNLVILYYKKDKPTFWIRQKDTLLIKILEIVAGFVLGFVSAWLIKN